MSVANAAGTPSYVGKFIPEIWSGQLNEKFYPATVLNFISNNKWEGEIKNKGDKVIIRTTPDITIRDYVKKQALQIEYPDAPTIELTIDHAKYFNFTLDDVDAYQSDLALIEDWSRDASQQMKNVIDAAVLNDIVADASASNTGIAAGVRSGGFNLGATGAPVALTKANIVEYITAMSAVLDEQNVPQEGRWCVIPAWARWMFINSDLKDASMTGDGKTILRNGRIGVLDNMTIYVSNAMNAVVDGAVSAYNILAGHKSALTFASQITKVESLRTEQTFADLIRGLNVYGYKVVKPEAMAVLYAHKA